MTAFMDRLRRALTGRSSQPRCRPTGDTDGRESPCRSLRFSLAGADALICYGSPAAWGRTVFGELVPFGELWRTGADEPTILHLSAAARVAGLLVEPGRYSIYTVPEDGPEWTLVLNASTAQGGRTRTEVGRKGNAFPSQYTPEVEASEVGRVPVRAEGAPFRESLDFSFEEAAPDEGRLVLEWERTRVVVPLSPVEDPARSG